jgi:hypothetical protein
MKIFLLLIFLYFCQKISCRVNCSPEKKYVKNRKLIKTTLREKTPVYFMLDYAVFNETSINKKGNFLIKVFNTTEKFWFPFLMTKDQKLGHYSFKAFSNRNGYITNGLNMTEVNENSKNAYKSFLEREKCSEEKIKVKKFVVNSSESFCFAFISCHIEATKNNEDYSITKSLIFLVNRNLNQSYNLNLYAKNFIYKNVKFPEFDEKGFCVCDDLLYYMNDCQEDKLFTLFNFFLILGVIVLFYVINEIYHKINKSP